MTRRGFDLVAGKTKTGGRRSHVRFWQTYVGISVFATETVVQLNEEGGVEYVSSDIITDLEPFNGSYNPEGNLSDLIGRSVTGTWTLEVTDDYERDDGKLLSWALFIEILSSEEIDIVKQNQIQ
jgi:hypothetical protein